MPQGRLHPWIISDAAGRAIRDYRLNIEDVRRVLDNPLQVQAAKFNATNLVGEDLTVRVSRTTKRIIDIEPHRHVSKETIAGRGEIDAIARERREAKEVRPNDHKPFVPKPGPLKKLNGPVTVSKIAKPPFSPRGHLEACRKARPDIYANYM